MNPFLMPDAIPPAGAPASANSYQRCIISPIMPAREVHLLAGPPGVNKTGLAVQMFEDLQARLPFFGFPTSGAKAVFISCDRSQESHFRRMDGFALPTDRFPFYSQVTYDPNVKDLLYGCSYAHPDCELIFIDGFQILLQDASPNDYGAVARLLRETLIHAQNLNKTILASVHATKSREGNGYASPREQILGSQAWSGFSDLNLILQPYKLEDPEDQRRILYICSRSSAGNVKRVLAPDPATGRLIEWIDPAEVDLLSLLDAWLFEQDFTRLIPKAEIVDYGTRQCALAIRTIERWLTAKVERGLLSRVAKGKYQRTQQVVPIRGTR